MVMETQVNSTIFTGKGDADTCPSTGTVDAQGPVFTRVHQASIGLQWLMFYSMFIQFQKSTIGARLSLGSRRDLMNG